MVHRDLGADNLFANMPLDRSDPLVSAATERFRIKPGVLDEVRMMVEVSRPGRTQEVEGALWRLNMEFEELAGEVVS